MASLCRGRAKKQPVGSPNRCDSRRRMGARTPERIFGGKGGFDSGPAGAIEAAPGGSARIRPLRGSRDAGEEEGSHMKAFYDADANVGLIRQKKVAIIGYGSQGHAHA